LLHRQFEKEVSLKPGKGVENVTSNCMGRAVRQFEKEVRFSLGTEVGYISSNCMGRTVGQFEKEVSFRLGTAELLCHRQFQKSL